MLSRDQLESKLWTAADIFVKLAALTPAITKITFLVF